MKITVRTIGQNLTASVPYEGAGYVNVAGACPKCGAAPWRAAGVKGTTQEGHDTITGAAGCVECGATVGQIVVKVDTIFGIEEDRRVLMHGRPRVY